MAKHAWNPFLRFPRSSLAISVLVCLPLFLLLPRFKVSSEAHVLLEGDQRNLASYEKVKQILADTEVVVISLECPDVFSPQGIDAVRRVSDALQPLAGVEDVKSLTHSVKPVRRGLGFEMVPLVPSGLTTAQEIESFKRFCLEQPLIRDVMVAADGKHTLITVTLSAKANTQIRQRKLRDEIDAALEPFQREGFRFQILAVPLIEDEIRSTLRSDAQKFLPASAILLAVILGWTFRSLRILLLVLANQLFVLLLLPGAMELTGFSLSVFTVMLFPLLSGIHLAQLAHVYSSFQAFQRAGQGAADALHSMLDQVFKSCGFSLLTTAIGLLSLAISDVRQIQEFGFLGTFGVVLIFVLTFGPGLALMKIVFERWPLKADSTDAMGPDRILTAESADGRGLTSGRRERSWLVRVIHAIGGLLDRPSAGPRHDAAWLDWLIHVVQKRGSLIVAAVGVAALFDGLGISQVRTDIRAVEFLNRRSPTRQAVEELDKTYGGINVVQIEIDSGAEHGINQLEFLRYVEKLQRFAESYPGVSAAYSYAQLLAMINQIWEEGRPEALQLPENPLLINLFVLALKSQNYPFLTALCDPSFRIAHLVVRTRDMPSDRYLAIISGILRHAEQNKLGGISVSATAGIHSILEADRRILRSQISSAGSSTAVIGLVLTLLWRSPRLALLSLLTNAVPVAFVIAIAGYAGVPLNSITIMVAAICLGIAVDDSIHFITHWRDAVRAGLSAPDAVADAFRIKGRPIVFTSVILIAIFSIFWFSSFPPVVHFGLLSAIAFLGALATVLFFLPAVLCFYRR
ncbi:MAG: MMPL family transporter [Verrucomicrobia bacterium]|nr:MMPL family transporter [Verrucomicrobiota bacterium]